MSETLVAQERLAGLFARSALWWLLLAALMGVWLRWQAWGTAPFSLPFRFLTHAHSHVMFLGWAFNGLAAGLILYFLPKEIPVLYKRLWLILQLGVLGMAISFPMQGYKAVSISFSTLHMFVAGWLAIRLWLDTIQTGPANLAFRWAVVFLVISSMGPFALAYIMVNGLEASNWYQLAVYYYLHFQYNGWMIVALLAIFLSRTTISGRNMALAVHLFSFGVLFSYAISTLWTSPPVLLYVLAGTGALLQLVAAVFVAREWLAQKDKQKEWANAWSYRLFMIGLLVMGIKLLLQLVAIWPEMGTLIFINRNWLIAYFHLVFIGVVTMLLAALFVNEKWLPGAAAAGTAWWLYVAGFVLSEIVLALPGTYPLILFVVSVLMTLALLWLVLVLRK